MIHGRQISVDESLSKFNAVTIEDVQSLATEHFRTKDMAFAALGDLEGLSIGGERLSI